MKIFVTGETGFIGSELVPRLVEANHDVYSLVRPITGRDTIAKTVAKTVFGDLRDAFTINNLMKRIQPDIVIHLAAISAVSYSYDHPQEILEVNTLGTINLAESCLRNIPHFKQLLYASTSEVYGIQTKFPIEETAELRPNSPYSVSKVASDNYLQYMRLGYDFPVTVLRPYNSYGRKNDVHFVVERIIVQMLQLSTIQLGNPTGIRDFMYVDDHVNAYLMCLDNPKAIGETFNFCTGVAVSIEELADVIADLTDFNGEIKWGALPARPLDIKKLLGSYEKAKKMLEWQPEYSLISGLKKTIEFWRTKLEA